ncbi:MAG: hypothetical protein M1817_002175 [Caeruleum heppii]|nr:MAG: hypothetical protein M1817_002175 [Caeruleum heppii]
MVLITRRLNTSTPVPNSHILFIKPIPSPPTAQNVPSPSQAALTEVDAEKYLSALAASVYPIMKNNHLSITSLEEYAPNPEFLGRNFNAGEVVQLVLRSRSSSSQQDKGQTAVHVSDDDPGGSFLPFRHVQMVFIHELAHCLEMNHSKAFWAVRNRFAEELKDLWAKGYTGEGLWSKGRSLTTGAWMQPGRGIALGAHEGVREVCGGTFRSRRNKRKRKGGKSGEKKVSYAERQQKRIARKFGIHGEGLMLGSGSEAELPKAGDRRLKVEDGFVKLEENPSKPTRFKKAPPKPRVAGSKRGRELRAQAALARFGNASARSQEDVKHEEEAQRAGRVKEEDVSSETETEDEDDNDTVKIEGEEARDTYGVKILDDHGRDLVRVCAEDESNGNGSAAGDSKKEMDELREIDHGLRDEPFIKLEEDGSDPTAIYKREFNDETLPQSGNPGS